MGTGYFVAGLTGPTASKKKLVSGIVFLSLAAVLAAQEIVDDLEQFRLIANDLGEAPENGNMSESFHGKV